MRRQAKPTGRGAEPGRSEALEQRKRELLDQIGQLETQLADMERSLTQGRLARFRTELLDRVQRAYVESFREKHSLIPARYGELEAWGVLRGRMRACLVVKNVLEDALDRGIGTVEEMVEMVREKLAQERSRFEVLEQPDRAVQEILGWVEEARRNDGRQTDLGTGHRGNKDMLRDRPV